MPEKNTLMGESGRHRKWREGDQVYWQDRETVWTVQPGECAEGPAFVHITAPGYSAVVWQDSLVLVNPNADRPS